jgi:hypothetical protein
MNPAATPSVSDRFAMALEGLYGAVAGRCRSGVISVAMIWLVCERIRRARRRVLRLLARFQAGWRPVARPAQAGRAGVVAVRVPRGNAKLPRQFGWLLALVPCEAANFASQLRGVLAEPEMMGLLAAVPRAGHALRSVCRMLAIEPEVLIPTDAANACPAPQGAGQGAREGHFVPIMDRSALRPTRARFQVVRDADLERRSGRDPPSI